MAGEMIAAGLLAGRLNLDPGSWLAWIVVGLIAGAIAARVVAGRGFGCIADLVVGVGGALVGGFLLGGLCGAHGTGGLRRGRLVGHRAACVLLTVPWCV